MLTLGAQNLLWGPLAWDGCGVGYASQFETEGLLEYTADRCAFGEPHELSMCFL